MLPTRKAPSTITKTGVFLLLNHFVFKRRMGAPMPAAYGCARDMSQTRLYLGRGYALHTPRMGRAPMPAAYGCARDVSRNVSTLSAAISYAARAIHRAFEIIMNPHFCLFGLSRKQRSLNRTQSHGAWRCARANFRRVRPGKPR